MNPGRGRCLVRKVETQESYAGGKVLLPESVREKIASQQVEIVAVGDNAWCEAEDCDRYHVNIPGCLGGSGGFIAFRKLPTHPFHGKPGDWAVVAPRSLTESGEEGLYLVAQEDVLAVLSA